jgi:hypothetical protein
MSAYGIILHLRGAFSCPCFACKAVQLLFDLPLADNLLFYP